MAVRRMSFANHGVTRAGASAALLGAGASLGTALVLHDGGLPMNTQVLFAGQVMQQVSRIAALQAHAQ